MEHLWKKFLREGFEDEIKADSNAPNLLITEENGGKPPKQEKPKEKDKTKKPEAEATKRTATTVHLEIKELVEAGDPETARTVLKKAFNDGFKGKRLDKWFHKLTDWN